MNDATEPRLYLILGATGSGRREVVTNLATEADADYPGDRVWRAATEPTNEADAELTAEGARVETWTAESATEIAAAPPPEAGRLFFIVDGRADPVDEIERFDAWRRAHGLAVARVLTVLDCALLHAHPELKPWFEACIFFSDVVLLNRREGVPDRWIKQLQETYEKCHYPAQWAFVKKGRVDHPETLLFPEARRLTHLFDEEEDLPLEEGAIQASGGMLDEEAEDEEADEPWLERYDDGRRMRPLPDIRPVLDARA